jgi:hypothetical protein
MTPDEMGSAIRNSPLHTRYVQAVDRESAREMLQARGAAELGKGRQETAGGGRGRQRAGEGGMMETAGTILNSRTAQTVVRELTRGLMGVLGIGQRRR